MSITDDDAEKAADWLRDNARKAGALRGERIKAEEYRKSLKAILFSQAPAGSAQSKEAWAYAHERYTAHLEVLQKAVVEDETNRALREAAIMRIQTWQTWSANVRGKL